MRWDSWLTRFALFVVIFAITAHWYGVANVDAIGAAWPGWVFVRHGTFFLEGVPDLPPIPWFSESGGHVVSNRTVGVILAGVPVHFLLLPFDAAPLTGATLAAVLVTAAAMANLSTVLRRLGASSQTALAWTAVVALGTGIWTNAAAELWTHGPDIFWLSLAMLAASRNRQWLVGLALAPAIATRPHLALVAASMGLTLALSSRTWRPVYRVGLPSSLGLLGVMAWNRAMFASASIEGGYSYALDNATATSPDHLWLMVESATGSLVSPLRGLLVFSPVVLPALLLIRRAVRQAPAWTVAAFMGGTTYTFLQWRINAFTGGTGFYSYRLMIEFVFLAAPAAYVGYATLAEQSPIRHLTRMLGAISIGIHTIGVFWYQPLGAGGQELDPWRTWGPLHAATSRGPTGTIVAAIAFTVIILLAMIPSDQFRQWWRRAGQSRTLRFNGAIPS